MEYSVTLKWTSISVCVDIEACATCTFLKIKDDNSNQNGVTLLQLSLPLMSLKTLYKLKKQLQGNCEKLKFEPNCTREPRLKEPSIIGVSFAILFPPLSSSFDPRVTPMQNWAVDTGSKTSEKTYLSGVRSGKRDHSELERLGDTHLFFFCCSLVLCH